MTLTTPHDNTLRKYHQAAYTYLVMGLTYMGVFYTTLPHHYFSPRVRIVAPIIGVLFMGLAWFIYHGYRKLTLVLAVIYAVRVIGATVAMFFFEGHVAVPYVLPLLIFTFYMLCRAVWDWRP